MTPKLAATDAPPAAHELLHGFVVAPPELAWNAPGTPAPHLRRLDQATAARLPGVVRIVVRGAFVGIVALQPQQARFAAGALRPQWDPLPEDAPESGDVAPTQGGTLAARYRWPLRPRAAHVSAVARVEGGTLQVWAPLQATCGLQQTLASLLQLEASAIRLTALPGHAGTDPAAAGAAVAAALLAQAVGRPVAVEVRPEDPFPGAWWHASTLTGQVAQGLLTGVALHTPAVPHAAAPLPAVLAGTGAAQALPDAATPPQPLAYAVPGAVIRMQPATGAAPLAAPAHGVREAQVFAQESFIDEAARAAGADPVALRLQHLDGRGAQLVRQVAERADWGTTPPHDDARLARGRGFAYAHVPDDHGESWSAWVVDVAVDRRSGDVSVTRVVVGHDAARADATPGDAQLQQQAEALARQLTHAPGPDTWGTDATGPAPAGDALALPGGALAPPAQPGLAPVLRTHAAAMLPAAAAVANAIHDATGVRLREPPFAGAPLRQALTAPQPPVTPPRKGAWAVGAALAAGAVAALAPWSTATRPIAPTNGPATGLYADATIERGRLVAAAGDCVACHTAPGGAPNAGGLGLPTPFGTIYTTNITPDVDTGIGAWSYAAFERAMRHGIGRDGRHLYPAFPYTAFARISDDDMQALYAYLMAQPPVRHVPPATNLPFPYSLRPLLGGWKAAFHDATSYQPDPTRSVQWNRGAYLVNGVGHCGACHTPRNALGAEQAGAFLAGGEAEGWRAPALGAASKSPVPWTEEALFQYLRYGSAPLHGPAAGPMQPVIQGLAQLPESDVRAIAHYLTHLPDAPPAADEAQAVATAQRLQARSDAAATSLVGPGARLYAGACASCHEPGPGGLLAEAKLPLAFNANLHDDRPDNLVQVLLHGVQPALPTLGAAMPGFADTLDDAQVADLARHLRARFAPERGEWSDLAATIARLRAQAGAGTSR